MALEERARGLEGAAQALAGVERALAAGASPHLVIADLPERIRMQHEREAMRKYFTDAAWQQFARAYYDDWPPPKYRDLYREAVTMLAEPGSERAQRLLARVVELWFEDAGPDPEVARQVREGTGLAWADRANWPDTLRQRYAEYRIEEIAKFLGRASIVAFTRHGLDYFARIRHRAS
jgi:hypothetical protein